MKKYIFDGDLKNTLVQLTNKLSQIEVKGDSVETLFASRLMIKNLYEKITEEEEEEEEDAV